MPLTNRKVLDQGRAENPKAGDSWHDHYCPACLVVGVTDKHVIITKKYEAKYGTSEWQWPDNPTELMVLTREEFVKYLTYNSNPSLGLWASCIRQEVGHASINEESG